MSQRAAVHQKAESFFEDLWKRGDFWELESSEFEQAKYARQLALLDGRRYARVLEIGCGAGYFTRQLAPLADRLVALDIAPTAIARARGATPEPCNVEFHVENVMDSDSHLDFEGPWDLIVMSETVYYLGWLYPFFDVAWLAVRLFSATNRGGRLLTANTFGGVGDYLLRPFVIRTYRDLFVNVGYQVEVEEIFRGNKNGADLEVLISLFFKGIEEEQEVLRDS
jgi:SAM-dependent methyltransferase